jgi:hypothetical protein
MEPSDGEIKIDKYKLTKKKWMENNLEKYVIASKKYYDSKKDDPEFKEKLRLRTQMRRERIKQEQQNT